MVAYFGTKMPLGARAAENARHAPVRGEKYVSCTHACRKTAFACRSAYFILSRRAAKVNTLIEKSNKEFANFLLIMHSAVKKFFTCGGAPSARRGRPRAKRRAKNGKNARPAARERRIFAANACKLPRIYARSDLIAPHICPVHRIAPHICADLQKRRHICANERAEAQKKAAHPLRAPPYITLKAAYCRTFCL